MQKRITMILDGDNVVHGARRFRNLGPDSSGSGREALIRYCIEWRQVRKDVSEFYVVFDGEPQFSGERQERVRNVKIVHSGGGRSADDRIVSIVSGAVNSAGCVVVSNDNDVRQRSRSLGAEIMSVKEFECVLVQKRTRRVARQESDEKYLTPAEEKKITDDLKKEWGIDSS